MRNHPNTSTALALFLVLTVGCTSQDPAPAATVTTLGSTTTAGTPATTTALERVTTTTEVATTIDPNELATSWTDLRNVNFPDQPESLSDLPEPFLRYIERQSPTPDLTIEAPEDLERWVNEWVDWMIWIGVHPDQGKDQVDVGWIPGTPDAEATQAGLAEQAEQGVQSFAVPFNPTSITGTFDEFFDSGQLLTVFIETEDTLPGYRINPNGEVDTREPTGERITVQLTLRPTQDHQWRVEQIQVIN